MPQVHRVTSKSAHAVKLEQEMQGEYVGMYGEPDQDPDNSMYSAESVLLLTEHDEPIGVCAWGRWPNGDGKIRLIYVTPAHRRRGYAEMLLRYAEEEMRFEMIPRARFESGPLQAPAHRMYDNNGYARTTKGFGFYRDAPGSVFFEKEL